MKKTRTARAVERSRRATSLRRVARAAARTVADRRGGPARPGRPDAYTLRLEQEIDSLVEAIEALRHGELSVRVPTDGPAGRAAAALNDLAERLRFLSTEVTRVAREVGTEGKLGGQADVSGMAGAWRALTNNVNLMAGNLTTQVRNIAQVTTAVANGDLSQKIEVDARGEVLELKNTINMMVEQLRAFAAEVTRVAKEVGTDGKLGGQADVKGVSGTWKDLTDSVNMLAGNLTSQVRNIAKVTTAVAKGDLTQKITVDARGEILELKDTINSMVEQLRTFAAEVTRVAREVGTEGKLGGQATVPGVAGTWKDLTDNVNGMASNLTSQVRGIIRVVTSVASGDLTKKLIVEAKGEIAALADTINAMTDTLRTFAEQVTTVARKVGIEGQLGGQAEVPGAAGTWRDLVDNVNQLAGNLTTQVRAISEVATAVTKGDLTRTIDVVARGEVLSLKDTINQMIANLKDTTHTNEEQDWLKTNLAKFTGMMQGQRSVEALAALLMSELTPVVSAQLGTFFAMEPSDPEPALRLVATYGYEERKGVSNRYAPGQGLVGQVALEKKRILVSEVPPDYVRIGSSLGSAPPRNVVVLPILFEGRVKGVVELGSFREFSPIHLTFLEQLTLSIGVVMNMINASRRTEELLQELQRSNSALESRSRELEDKASLLEVKNREIAEASTSLEEKARQLALVSKYKSEFLANMSHELRTPLNSMLMLSELLLENGERNLTARQSEYVRTIHGAGHDLLALISQILDLSKIEAGKMQIDKRSVPLAELRSYADRHFRPLSQQKGLAFAIAVAPEVPPSFTTDSQRVEQILKNLLSNAFKFTDAGRVELRVFLETDVRRFRTPALARAPAAVAFAVSDTGIGIPPEKRQLVFEAFQQADPSTSRTHGGTGLGLTISRELARLLGGELALASEEGKGSTFTLYLPLLEGERASPGPLRAAADRAPEPAQPGAPEALVPARADAADLLDAAAPAEPRKTLAGKKVLVVDDDVRNVFAVTSLLEHHGIEAPCAASAAEALAALQRQPDMDAVLLDVMMPDVDGHETARRIRGIEALRRMPVIALTAKAMPGDRERCLEAGCTDFLAKPVDAARLLAALERALATGEPRP